jgi:hypothetical protein
MKKLALWGLGGFVGLMVITGLLPTVSSEVGTFVDTATTVILALAPKVALGSAALGLVLLCFHWTRAHAHKMIVFAIVCAIGSAALSVAFSWFSTESASVAPTATTLAGDLVARVVGGLQAGIGGH